MDSKLTIIVLFLVPAAGWGSFMRAVWICANPGWGSCNLYPPTLHWALQTGETESTTTQHELLESKETGGVLNCRLGLVGRWKCYVGREVGETSPFLSPRLIHWSYSTYRSHARYQVIESILKSYKSAQRLAFVASISVISVLKLEWLL